MAYGVNKILEPVGRASIPKGEQEFPNMPPAIFKEIPHKRLDLLVGLSDLKYILDVPKDLETAQIVRRTGVASNLTMVMVGSLLAG